MRRRLQVKKRTVLRRDLFVHSSYQYSSALLLLLSNLANYCVKVDMLLSGMAAGQRRRFTTLLNTLIGAGICRAPSCKPQILPSVAMQYTLPGATCDAFMAEESKVLSDQLRLPIHLC
jgi:hypothetical protein